ncbi:unnamed protein product, partial [marine sediment metagenome]
MGISTLVSERIERLRERYQTEMPIISIERAKFYTEKYFEGNSLPQNMRVALSMKHVYENMTHYVDPDDRIAGYWCESFLGIPIEIERGIFNNVLRNELKKRNILWFRIKSYLKTAWWLLKKRQLFTAIRNMRNTGKQPMNMGITPMDKRKINPYKIAKAEKKILLKKLLPQWKGKSIVNIIEKEIAESGLVSGNMLDFSIALPANNSKQVLLISMTSNIAFSQGHVILDYEKAITRGLFSLKTEVEEKLEDKSLNLDDKSVLQSIKIAMEGVIIFAKRLAERVQEAYEAESDETRKNILKIMLENCQKVPFYPPETFYQAVQSAWTIKTAVELAHPINLHSFGRMDQIFYP